jgi:hypothetical protein
MDIGAKIRSEDARSYMGKGAFGIHIGSLYKGTNEYWSSGPGYFLTTLYNRDLRLRSIGWATSSSILLLYHEVRL